MVQDSSLGRSGRPNIVVGGDHVQELSEDAGLEAAGSALDEP